MRGYIFWIYVEDLARNINSTSVNFTVSTATTVTLEGGGGGGYVPPLTTEAIKEAVGLNHDLCNCGR